jgi:hypothetical protein
MVYWAVEGGREISCPAAADFLHLGRPVRIYRVCTAILGLSVAASAFGQTPDSVRDFSTLTVRGAAGPQHTDDRLARFYTPGTALSLEAGTPFQIGELSASVARAKYQSVGSMHPDFTSLTAALGWRYLLTSRAVDAGLGVHFGAMQFAFRDSVIDPGQRDEREVLMGVNALLSVHVASHVSAIVEGSYSHVWLHVPVHIASLTVGLGYSATMPAWLRDFLR